MKKLKALFVAAAFAAFASTGAMAADLGGNCCADLEERVAELEATHIDKGNRRVSVQISGHVHEQVLFFDGDTSPIIRNAPRDTGRLSFRGQARINTEWAAGFFMEIGVQREGIRVDDAEAQALIQTLGLGQLDIRHQAVFVNSKALGTIWLGYTSQATRHITNIDLSQAEQFSRTLDLTLSGGNIGAGGVRRNVIKWISPEVAGVTLSASWSPDDSIDGAIRLNEAKFGSFKLSAGLGAQKFADEGSAVAASASIKEGTSGLFLTVAAAETRDANADPTTLDALLAFIENDQVIFTDRSRQFQIRGGIDKKLVSFGTTTVFAEYGKAYIKGQQDLSFYGGGIVQGIDPAAMQLAAVVRWNEQMPVFGEEAADDSFSATLHAKIKF